MVDVLNEGYDIVVRIGPLGDAADLMTKIIGVQKMAIFAAPTYLETHGVPTSVADLHDHTGVLYGKSPRSRAWHIRDADGTEHDVTMKSRQRYDDLEAVLEATLEGGGVAWLPSWFAAPQVEKEKLRNVLDTCQSKPLEIRSIWPKSKFLPQRTRVVIDALSTRVSTMMGT